MATMEKIAHMEGTGEITAAEAIEKRHQALEVCDDISALTAVFPILRGDIGVDALWAEECFARILDAFARQGGRQSIQYADLLLNVAVQHEMRGDHERAIRYGERSLELVEKNLGRDHEEAVETREWLAELEEAE